MTTFGKYGEPSDLSVMRHTFAWGSVVAASHPGLKRARNEDSYALSRSGRTLALADGMGGHANGAKAAQTSTAALVKPYPDEGEARLRQGFRDAQREVMIDARSALEADPSLKRRGLPGAALAALRIAPDLRSFAYGWAGDVRIYVWDERGLERVTRDHAVQGQLTKCIGGVLGAPPDPGEYGVRPVRSDQEILLCSDGLHTYVPEATIRDVLGEAPTREVALRHLFGAACAEGAPDNVTIALVRVDGRAL